VLEAIVIRPGPGARRDVESAKISLAGGVEGDRWFRGGGLKTDDGQPHPDVQICIMNARCIELIAGARDNWSLAGDNLFVDLALDPENLPPGTRLAIGSAIIEITAVAHTGCDRFAARYGREACVFVNVGAGKRHRLRGVYARVVRDGRVSVGDRIRKLAGDAAA
jgi:MOSC domain-containing protein YiiM